MAPAVVAGEPPDRGRHRQQPAPPGRPPGAPDQAPPSNGPRPHMITARRRAGRDEALPPQKLLHAASSEPPTARQARTQTATRNPTTRIRNDHLTLPTLRALDLPRPPLRWHRTRRVGIIALEHPGAAPQDQKALHQQDDDHSGNSASSRYQYHHEARQAATDRQDPQPATPLPTRETHRSASPLFPSPGDRHEDAHQRPPVWCGRRSGPCCGTPGQQTPSMSQEQRTLATKLIRGMGSFFKTCACKHQGRCSHLYTVRFRNSSGRQLEETGFPTQDDALDRLTAIYSEKRRTPVQQAELKREIGKLRFGQYAASWLPRQRHYAPGSIRTVNQLLDSQILPILDSRRVNTFSSTVIEDFILSMEDRGVGLATQQNAFDTLKKILLAASDTSRYRRNTVHPPSRRSAHSIGRFRPTLLRGFPQPVPTSRATTSPRRGNATASRPLPQRVDAQLGAAPCPADSKYVNIVR